MTTWVCTQQETFLKMNEMALGYGGENKDKREVDVSHINMRWLLA